MTKKKISRGQKDRRKRKVLLLLLYTSFSIGIIIDGFLCFSNVVIKDIEISFFEKSVLFHIIGGILFLVMWTLLRKFD